jgi:hypothetical protein
MSCIDNPNSDFERWQGVADFRSSCTINFFIISSLYQGLSLWITSAATSNLYDVIKNRVQNPHAQRAALWAASFGVAFAASFASWLLFKFLFGFDGTIRERSSIKPCECAVSGVYFDLHDLNTKRVQLNADGSVTITPVSPGQTTVPGQSWSVTTMPLDSNCSAQFDFDVPNKPDPPGKPLRGEFVCLIPGETVLQFSTHGAVVNAWTRLAGASGPFKGSSQQRS